MNVFIRTDASNQIGSGHVMRCLTLADFLHSRSNSVSFICRDHPDNMIEYIERKKYAVEVLSAPEYEKDLVKLGGYEKWLTVSTEFDSEQTSQILSKYSRIDWLVVDHYALDESWHKAVRQYSKKIMVIDDLANRKYDCDLILDQNLNGNMNGRYGELVSEKCIRLIGPEFALLRPEFSDVKRLLKEHDGSIKNILIFLGGVDNDNLTARAIEAVTQCDSKDLHVDVIVGMNNSYYEEIREICNNLKSCEIYRNVNNMAELMARADLAIGAAGTTSWERTWLGMPSIVVVLAENQKSGAEALHRAGAAWNLGFHTDVTSAKIRSAIEFAVANPNETIAMSKRALNLLGDDPRPGVEKVYDAMKEVHDALA
ncbi:MAG: UDP-2,4-diacetamido-2,4,6-trideoxy-beta-L-altropyranose hydrolase [candidate division Zixibacteria bacterium]